MLIVTRPLNPNAPVVLLEYDTVYDPVLLDAVTVYVPLYPEGSTPEINMVLPTVIGARDNGTLNVKVAVVPFPVAAVGDKTWLEVYLLFVSAVT